LPDKCEWGREIRIGPAGSAGYFSCDLAAASNFTKKGNGVGPTLELRRLANAQSTLEDPVVCLTNFTIEQSEKARFNRMISSSPSLSPLCIVRPSFTVGVSGLIILVAAS